MTDVFPLPLPITLAVPTSTQQFANACPGEREHCGLLLTNMSIAGATWRNGVRTLNAILKLPCFRFAVYDHNTRRRVGSQSSSGRHLLRQDIDLKVYGAGSLSSGGCNVFVCTDRQA
jgi:hypothetical protein